MPRYLLTHSLLSSWLYAMRDNPYEDATTERDPMAEFMLALRREPTPRTEAMQNGIVFEDLVSAILRGDEYFGYYEMNDQDGIQGMVPAGITGHKWYAAAAKIAEHVRNGAAQYKARREVKVNGCKLLLYGRLDWLKAGEIIDCKFTTNYDPGKFYESTQHPMYFELIPEAHTFTYLVSNGSAVWSESYRRDETPSILPIASDFLEWLRVAGLFELYASKWEAV